MDAPKCKFCGVVEWRHICSGLASGLASKLATNGATNTATNAKKDATNIGRRVHTNVTLNRRDRADYNAYQKMYMAVRRAVKSGRADPWPKGS